MDVAALTPDGVDRLKAVFWDMCAITSEVETIPHPDGAPDDDTDDIWTERILHGENGGGYAYRACTVLQYARMNR